MEAQQVLQLKTELEQEKSNQIKRKIDERNKIHQFYEQNEKNKRTKMEQAEKEKLEDIRAQEAYMKMLDKQEKYRANEFAVREKRAKVNQEKMAGHVIKDINERQRREEENMIKFIKEQELRNILKEQERK